MNNYYDDDDFLDEDEKAERANKYHDTYMQAMHKNTKSLPKERRDMLYREMEKIKYRPTNDAEQDCELNLLRAEKILASKQRKLNQASGGKIDSFLKYKQKVDGMSSAAANN